MKRKLSSINLVRRGIRAEQGTACPAPEQDTRRNNGFDWACARTAVFLALLCWAGMVFCFILSTGEVPPELPLTLALAVVPAACAGGLKRYLVTPRRPSSPLPDTAEPCATSILFPDGSGGSLSLGAEASRAIGRKVTLRCDALMLSWKAPSEYPIETCSFCENVVDEEDLPLIIRNNIGWSVVFCDRCEGQIVEATD